MTLKQAIRVLLEYAESHPREYVVDHADRDNFRQMIGQIAGQISQASWEKCSWVNSRDAAAAHVVICALRWEPDEWRSASRTVWATL